MVKVYMCPHIDHCMDCVLIHSKCLTNNVGRGNIACNSTLHVQMHNIMYKCTIVISSVLNSFGLFNCVHFILL